jgi:hypothetical protein
MFFVETRFCDIPRQKLFEKWSGVCAARTEPFQPLLARHERQQASFLITRLTDTHMSPYWFLNSFAVVPQEYRSVEVEAR